MGMKLSIGYHYGMEHCYWVLPRVRQYHFRPF